MSGTYGSTTTTLGSAIATKWKRDVIEGATGRLVGAKFAATDAMKRGEGGTLVYNRILRPSLVNSSSTTGTLVAGGSSGIKSLTSNKVSVTPSLFQDSFGFDDDVTIEAFFSNGQYKESIKNQMAISLDYQVVKMLSTQCLRHRIDADGTYQKAVTASAGTTTTSSFSGLLTEADDFWNGGYICVTNPDGPNYDHPARAITDFATSGDVVTHAAFPTASTTASKCRVTVGTGVVATDILPTTGLQDVLGLHDKLETEMFDDGYLRGFFDAAQHRDLLKDSVFLASMEYDNSEYFKGYRVRRWCGLEMLISSNLYREDVDGVEYGHGGAGTTGVCYVSPIFGRNAYALTPWGNGNGKFAVNWYIVDGADSYNLTANQHYISWKTFWGGTTLRSTSVIGLMTGATSQALLV